MTDVVAQLAELAADHAAPTHYDALAAVTVFYSEVAGDILERLDSNDGLGHPEFFHDLSVLLAHQCLTPRTRGSSSASSGGLAGAAGTPDRAGLHPGGVHLGRGDHSPGLRPSTGGRPHGHSPQPIPGAPAAAAGSAGCDDGAWQVAGAAVQGTPAGLDAGDAGRTYLWHDTGGWHLRTTDVTSDPHPYSGTIAASPGAAFTDVAKVKLDPGDQLYADDHHVLHYAFTTHQGIDGVNFRVTACNADRAHESLTFALRGNRFGDNPAGIDLGSGRAHPATDPFTARRTT